MIIYLDNQFTPVQKEEATIAKQIGANGEVKFYLLNEEPAEKAERPGERELATREAQDSADAPFRRERYRERLAEISRKLAQSGDARFRE